MLDALTDDEIMWAKQIAFSPAEEKQEFIYELMIRCHWYGRESCRALAQHWEEAVTTIHVYSKRSRKRTLVPLEELYRERALEEFNKGLEQLDYIIADAARKKKSYMDKETGRIHMVPDPDHTSVLRAIEMKFKLLGLYSDKRTSQALAKSESKFDSSDLQELIEQGQRAGVLAEPTPQFVEEAIVTTGEDTNDGTQDIQDTLPNRCGGTSPEGVVRGGLTRRDKDPIGGRDSFGSAREPTKHRIPTPRIRDDRRGLGEEEAVTVEDEGRSAPVTGPDSDQGGVSE